jgi:hypothetical protein
MTFIIIFEKKRAALQFNERNEERKKMTLYDGRL